MSDEKSPSVLRREKKSKEQQIDLAEQLQAMLLEAYATKLEKGELSDTGLSSLQKLLMQNGWQLDPTRVPQGLRDKLTARVDPKDVEDDDEPGVIPMRRPA